MFRNCFAFVIALGVSVSAFAQTSATVGESTAAPADSRKLVITKLVKAEYPAEAVLKGLQGQVVIRVRVSETGDVENAEVVSGDSTFHNAALSAVKQWKFRPFIKNGEPVKISTSISVPFSLDDVLATVPDAEGELVSQAEGLKRVRVSPKIAEQHVSQRVSPVYPEFSDGHRIFGTGISGTVELEAVIGKDGTVREVKEISGPPLLRQPAIAAVRKWRYRPFAWKGEDVEVATHVFVYIAPR